MPLAAYAELEDNTIYVRALVAEPDGSRVIRAEARGPVAHAEALGEQVAKQLLDDGAREILTRLAAENDQADAQ